MSKQMQTEKNKTISEKRRQTQLKRLSQVCKAYTIKIHESYLSRAQKNYLERTFREAKWWHNWALAMSRQDPEHYDLFHFWNGYKDITHKNKSGQDIQVKLTLHSQLKQAITDQMASNIRTLSILKKHNKQQPGQLKFKSEIRSINLKQYGSTHEIKNGKLKLAGFKRLFKVRGLSQIPANAEFANAKLIRKPDGYYIALTIYIDKDRIKTRQSNGQTIGIDFGCQTNFTLSNGQKYNAAVEEPERLKRLQRKLSKKQKNSNNYCKTCQLLNIEYQKMTNRKQDLANKLVAEFCKYETVVIQDEQLQNWHKIKYCSKKVQHSVLGRVKDRLMSKDNVIVLNKWLPTSKLCTNCGTIQNLKLSDRTFKCQCGISIDRDIHAAQNMVFFYRHNIGMGRTEFKRREIQDQIRRAICKPSLNESMKYEGSNLLVGASSQSKIVIA